MFGLSHQMLYTVGSAHQCFEGGGDLCLVFGATGIEVCVMLVGVD